MTIATGLGTVLIVGAAGVASAVIERIIEAKGKDSYYFSTSFGVAIAVVALYKVGELIIFISDKFII